MKSVKHKGLALAAVSSSVLGLGVGTAGTASALAWGEVGPSPIAAVKVTASVAGSGASAVLTVTTDDTGSQGQANVTDFGDDTNTSGATMTHTFKPGVLKTTITEVSMDTVLHVESLIQVGVDATDPGHIVSTRSVPLDLGAHGSWFTKDGTSAFDLSKILPAGASVSDVSGTCDYGTGALPLSVDAKAMLAVCDWTGPHAAGTHIVTLTYTDKTTGLKSSVQAYVGVPVQPAAVFQPAVLSPGLLRLDLTGSAMDVGTGSGAGVLNWGDGSKTTVTFPLTDDVVQNHQYASPGTKTVTFSITDRFGEHASSSAQVDVTKATADFGQVTRFAGATRYGTGVAASQQAFPFAHTADAVVLARGDVYADALAGIPLAKDKNGPLLLTPGGSGATALDPDVAAEIRRVLPADKKHTVYILGGTDAIPQRIQDYISTTLGYNVERFGGATRYETALDIAQEPQALNNPQHVVVARGDDFADALASGPYAAGPFADSAKVPAAIVLSTGNGVTEPVSLNPATRQYVTSKLDAAHPAGHPNVTAIGGGAVKAVAAVSGDFTPIAGLDRFDTSAKVAQHWDSTSPALGVASGTNFPDSLTGGALMALQHGPLLLSDPAAVTPPLSEAVSNLIIREYSTEKVTDLFGGTQVFSDTVPQYLLKLEGLSPSRYRVVQLTF